MKAEKKEGQVPEVIQPMKPLEGITGLVQEVFLDLMRTAELLNTEVEEFLKGYGISGTQYNALRILRGAGTQGQTCQGVIERMINRDPDVTRLLDRLEDRGLVVRMRSKEDRRVVRAFLTQAGLDLVEELDEPVAQLHVRQLGSIGEEQLEIIAQSLRSIRQSRTKMLGCDGGCDGIGDGGCDGTNRGECP